MLDLSNSSIIEMLVLIASSKSAYFVCLSERKSERERGGWGEEQRLSNISKHQRSELSISKSV